MLELILAFSLLLPLQLSDTGDDEFMTASTLSGKGNVSVPGMLNTQQVIQYIGQHAPAAGVDPAAMLAVAQSEGLNQSPGNFWTLPGEGNISFGPPSWFGGTPGNPAAGTPILANQGNNAPGWAWTPAGLDYWIQQISQVASGLRGDAAINAIVTGFERPLAKNVAPEVQNAKQSYQGYQQQIQGGSGVVTPLPGTTDVNPTVPAQSQPQTSVQGQGQASAGAVPPPTGLNLGFTSSVQHVIFQFLLVILALILLIGGIYLLGTRKSGGSINVNLAGVASKAAEVAE